MAYCGQKVQKNPEQEHDKCECIKVIISSRNDCSHKAVTLGPIGWCGYAQKQYFKIVNYMLPVFTGSPLRSHLCVSFNNTHTQKVIDRHQIPYGITRKYLTYGCPSSCAVLCDLTNDIYRAFRYVLHMLIYHFSSLLEEDRLRGVAIKFPE